MEKEVKMKPKDVGSGEVTFFLEGKEVTANREKLSAASDFFSVLLNSNTKESKEGTIRSEYMNESIMKDVLEFANSGNVQVTKENALDLIEAADYLLMPGLKTIAGKFVEKEMLSLANCIACYYFAKRYNCDSLESVVRKFIILNFKAVTKTQDFLGLESQQAEEWIRSARVFDQTTKAASQTQPRNISMRTSM
ncbi:gigaxonin-like [Montipora foliosa]|uniref:gigaxonin-like n=1 Tax=Montipora foliosa TaxID=591990 RepID=UPI0035F1EB3B